MALQWPLGVAMVRPIEPLQTLDPLALTTSAEQMGAVARRASDVGVQVQELSHFAVEGARRAGLLLGYGAIATAHIPEGLRRLRSCF